jgi:hypothetical protein
VKKNNFYTDAQLYVSQIIDEDGNVSYQFKDKQEQTVLTRQILNGSNVDTYFVYDDFGNLCFVLPPLAADTLIATNATAYDKTNSTQVKQYAYSTNTTAATVALPSGCLGVSGCITFMTVRLFTSQKTYFYFGEARRFAKCGELGNRIKMLILTSRSALLVPLGTKYG